jgi:hypothetical protein
MAEKKQLKNEADYQDWSQAQSDCKVGMMGGLSSPPDSYPAVAVWCEVDTTNSMTWAYWGFGGYAYQADFEE